MPVRIPACWHVATSLYCQLARQPKREEIRDTVCLACRFAAEVSALAKMFLFWKFRYFVNVSYHITTTIIIIIMQR